MQAIEGKMNASNEEVPFCKFFLADDIDIVGSPRRVNIIPLFSLSVGQPSAYVALLTARLAGKV